MSKSCLAVSRDDLKQGQAISPGLKEWLDAVIIPALVREWLSEPDDRGKSLVNCNEDVPDFKTKKNGSEVIH